MDDRIGTDASITAPAATDIEDAVRQAGMASDARIFQIRLGDQTFWVKRPEVQSVLNRLQKGPPERAFNREIDTLETLHQRHAPVPKVIHRGNDFAVLTDAGEALEPILRFQRLDEGERCRAMVAAGRALAGLHQRGLSHGRPLMRDIGWNGAEITFFDLENYRESNNNTAGHVRDLAAFLNSMYAQQHREMPEFAAAKEAYRAADTLGVWAEAARWARRRRWWVWLTAPMRARPDPHAREFKAIPLMLDALVEGASELQTETGQKGR